MLRSKTLFRRISPAASGRECLHVPGPVPGNYFSWEDSRKEDRAEIESNVGFSNFLSDVSRPTRRQGTRGLVFDHYELQDNTLEMLNFREVRRHISADEIESIIDNLEGRASHRQRSKEGGPHQELLRLAVSVWFDGPKFPRLKTPNEPDPYATMRYMIIRLEEMGHKNGLRLVMMQAMTGMRLDEVLGTLK